MAIFEKKYASEDDYRHRGGEPSHPRRKEEDSRKKDNEKSKLKRNGTAKLGRVDGCGGWARGSGRGEEGLVGEKKVHIAPLLPEAMIW